MGHTYLEQCVEIARCNGLGVRRLARLKSRPSTTAYDVGQVCKTEMGLHRLKAILKESREGHRPRRVTRLRKTHGMHAQSRDTPGATMPLLALGRSR